MLYSKEKVFQGDRVQPNRGRTAGSDQRGRQGGQHDFEHLILSPA